MKRIDRTHRSRDAKSYLFDAADVACEMVQQAGEKVKAGDLNENDRENFRLAFQLLAKVRELQLTERKINNNPKTQTLIINNTERELRALPDLELKALAKQVLAKDREGTK